MIRPALRSLYDSLGFYRILEATSPLATCPQATKPQATSPSMYIGIYVYMSIQAHIYIYSCEHLKHPVPIPQESCCNVGFSDIPRIISMFQDMLQFYGCCGCTSLPHAISLRTSNIVMYSYMFITFPANIWQQLATPICHQRNLIVSVQSSKHLQTRQNFRCRYMTKLAHRTGQIKHQSSFRWGPVNVCNENSMSAADLRQRLLTVVGS